MKKQEQGGYKREMTELEKQLTKLEYKFPDPTKANKITVAPSGFDSEGSTEQDMSGTLIIEKKPRKNVRIAQKASPT